MLDEEVRKVREDNGYLENQFLKFKSIVVELELEVSGFEMIKEELELECKKCVELRGKCESYVIRVEELEVSVDLLRKEVDIEKD